MTGILWMNWIGYSWVIKSNPRPITDIWDAGQCLADSAQLNWFPRVRLSVEKAIGRFGYGNQPLFYTISGAGTSRQNHYFFSSCAFAEQRESQSQHSWENSPKKLSEAIWFLEIEFERATKLVRSEADWIFDRSFLRLHPNECHRHNFADFRIHLDIYALMNFSIFSRGFFRISSWL